MEYRQFAPPPELAPWIECIWCLRGAFAPEGQSILPDGRIELVFHFGKPPEVEALGPQPDALVTGQMTEALQLKGSLDSVGVRLRPESGGRLLPAVLPDAGFHAMDSVLGAGARATRERAGNAPTDAMRVEVIVESLRILVRNAAEPDAAVAHSVRLIELHHGRGKIDRYLPVGLQTRQWQRRFFAATGLTPKAFARLTRLQRLVGLYESGLWRRWADLALETGFYDQSHLANEFRSFSGQSPDAFFREGRGMAEFYRDGFFQDRRAASR